MTNDVLAPFIAAYRDENPGTALDAQAIRRRMLVAVAGRRSRRAGALRYVLPIAATFVGSVALAASQGVLPRIDEVRAWFGIAADGSGRRAPGEERVRAKSAVGSPLSPPRLSPPVTEPLDETSAPVATPSLPVKEPEKGLSVDDLPLEGTVRAPVSAAGPAPRAPERALSADLRAYQEAHRLHFDGGEPSRALAAWNAYLASYPAGTFAPEARFNRAVCLLRLGRRDEAKSVLVPIAESSSFAYGRDRARALLDAMGE